MLFNDTIMHNIRYGNIDATDEEVWAAADAACIHEAITTRFPKVCIEASHQPSSSLCYFVLSCANFPVLYCAGLGCVTETMSYECKKVIDWVLRGQEAVHDTFSVNPGHSDPGDVSRPSPTHSLFQSISMPFITLATVPQLARQTSVSMPLTCMPMRCMSIKSSTDIFHNPARDPPILDSY